MNNAPDIVLLGDPVEQSRSPVFQNAGLAAIDSPWRYGVRRVDADGVRRAFDELRRGDLRGLNVTAPHKALAFALADERTAAARSSGAANTFWVDSGRVWADNTDIEGVRASVAALGVIHGAVVVLGAGGAGAAAALAVADLGSVTIVNRTVERARELATRLGDCMGDLAVCAWDDRASVAAAFAEASLVVNATSTSLAGEAGTRALDALPWQALRGTTAMLDLAYGPAVTPFLAHAPPGAPALDGATMLLHQGAAAFVRWTGVAAPVATMREALAQALNRDPAEIG